MLADAGAVDAAALAGAHLDKDVAELAVFQLVKHGAAVVHAVDGDAAVSLHLVGGLEHAAGGGIKARALAVARLHMVGGQLDMLGGQPVAQLVVGEGDIGIGAFVGLGLFGDARADEHRKRLRVLLLDGLAVRLHGGEHLGQVGEHGGVILLDEHVDGRAAAGNEHALLALAHDARVLVADHLRAHGGFLHLGKAQALEGVGHHVQGADTEIRDEGRGQAAHHMPAGGDGLLDAGHVVSDLLGLLGAGHEAVAAQDALVVHDLGSVVGIGDRLDRAGADALVAVRAVVFVEVEHFKHGQLPPMQRDQNRPMGLA